MRRLRQNAQMFFRPLGVGHGHELLFDFPLAGRVAETADGPVVRLLFVFVFVFLSASMIKRLQVRTNQHEEQNSTREKSHEAPCRNYCIQPA